MTSTLSNKNTIIIRNLPQGTEFGIDYDTWYVGPRFCGITGIPSGVHFIFTSSVDKEEKHSPRNGQFLVFTEDGQHDSQVHQTVWDEQNEELVACTISTCPISENDARNLAPYPCDDKYKTWKRLTSFITKETVERVCPLCYRISQSTQVDCIAELEKKERKRLGIVDSDNKHFNFVKIRFTKIPEQKFPDGAKPHEITKYNMDNSFALDFMLEKIKGNNVFDAFEHWKTLIRLICKCDDALNSRPSFFIDFVDIIEVQIKEIPPDFFVDIVAEQNFLVQTFQILFSTVRDAEHLDRRLFQRIKHLREFLTKTFDWDFDFEEDEDLPVVVDPS